MLLKKVVLEDGRTIYPDPMPFFMFSDRTEDGTYIIVTKDIASGKLSGYHGVVDCDVEMNDFAY